MKTVVLEHGVEIFHISLAQNNGALEKKFKKKQDGAGLEKGAWD